MPRSAAQTQSVTYKRGVFFAVVFAWIALDLITKYFAAAYEPGQVIYESRLGIVNFILVHNTGGAWSLFSGAPTALGIFSLIVCAGILFFLFKFGKQSSMLAYIALALVFAGGLGNVFDRFTRGYVIDFISTAFMDFPVFNVADIGVTVGMALFVISVLLPEKQEPLE